MRRVRSLTLGAIVVAVIAGGIALSAALGYWVTEGTRVPITYVEGEFAGSYNPADIRGSYTLADVEASFGIPVDVLARAFGVSELENPGEFRAADLEEMYGEQADGGEIGTDALRLFVSLYSGLPYVAEESTRFPATALVELDAKLATADLEALEARLVPDDTLVIAVEPELAMLAGEDEVEPAPEADATDTEEHDADEAVIRGKTTFGDLLGWGLTKEQIEEVLGMSMGARLKPVRDFAFEEGLDYGTVRTALQALLEPNGEPVSE
jgi:hypothetical protein